MATGLGKTVVFTALARHRAGRTLILAHRDELVAQAAAKLAEVWPDLACTPRAARLLADTGHEHAARLGMFGHGPLLGIVKGAADDVGADVVVASVQTLARERRLDRLARGSDFDLVIVDEAHHATAPSYQLVMTRLGIGLDTPDEQAIEAAEPMAPLLLGVTATPDRGDGLGLDKTFDEIVANRDILWGIKAGYLAELRALRVEVEHFDLGQVKVRQGDYAAGDAGRALEEAGGPRQIVAAWLEHALGRRTLVFTPTVATAQATAAEFAAAGISAGVVHGGTPLDERRAVLAAYSRGDVEVLCNCAVLTEGYDEPRTDCIVVARPTKSRALYTQMVGRGTRKHPDKADCLVLDVAGASRSHSLITVPSLFGLDDEAFRARLEDATGGLSEVVDEHAAELVKVGRLRAEEAELFAELRERGKIAWQARHWPDGRKRYERDLSSKLTPDAPVVVITERDAADPHSWLAGLRVGGGYKTMIAGQDMATAQAVAEDYIAKQWPETLRLVAHDAPWRGKPPTDGQRRAAKKWRIPKAKVDACATAGDLSELIDAYVALRTRR